MLFRLFSVILTKRIRCYTLHRSSRLRSLVETLFLYQKEKYLAPSYKQKEMAGEQRTTLLTLEELNARLSTLTPSQRILFGLMLQGKATATFIQQEGLTPTQVEVVRQLVPLER